MVNKTAIASSLKRATGEILLIVVGVTIALAADSWLAERAESARTERLLDSLEAEWSAELKRLDAYLDQIDLAMTAIIRTIHAHKDSPPNMTPEEAASLISQAYGWQTFKPFEGALNTLMEDGLQNIDDSTLRLAIASWRTVLAELDAEQAALREIGTLTGPRIGSKIAQKSDKAYSNDVREYGYGFGMDTGDYALAAFADDEWVANQRHLLNLLYRYQDQVFSVRETLQQNLMLLHDRAVD